MDGSLICTLLDKGNLPAALAEISDQNLLVSLACDFGRRVVALGPDPARSIRWLQETRNYRLDPEAARDATEEALAAWSRAAEDNAPTWLAARAVSWATKVATEADPRWVAGLAAWAAKEAAKGPQAELAWQIAHVRASACPYSASLSSPIDDTRSRTSLLAC